MILKSAAAKDIEFCIQRLARQCAMHRGEAFVFPDENIYTEVFDDVAQDRIEWKLTAPRNDVFFLSKITQQVAAFVKVRSFKKSLLKTTGLTSRKKKDGRDKSGVSTIRLSVEVTKSYSEKIYKRLLRAQAEESRIVDDCNVGDAKTKEMVTELRMQIIRNNGEQIAKIAKAGTERFGQAFVVVKNERVEICRGSMYDIDKTIAFSDLGLSPLISDIQLYALSIELANAISDILQYPRVKDNAKYFVKLEPYDNYYRIVYEKESVFDSLTDWGKKEN